MMYYVSDFVSFLFATFFRCDVNWLSEKDEQTWNAFKWLDICTAHRRDQTSKKLVHSDNQSLMWMITVKTIVII